MTGNGDIGTRQDQAAERDLVERARGGDRGAFADLYRLHYGSVFRLARFYLPSGAEDAAAETFLRAWSSLPRYRFGGAPFSAWLYAIARHVVVDELRKAGRTETRAVLPETARETAIDESLGLADAIARLSPSQRRVIEMKYLMGMTNPEVAALLKRSVGAVNALQWRALQALNEMLQEDE